LAGKRLLDVLLAGGAIVLFTPFWILLVLLVRLRMGAPVLFRQERPGREGRPFTLFKFRSMTQARGADGALLPDDQRLTRFGRLLRASSFDELPELLNILRGEMSLVGPRPLLVRYLPLYTPTQARRHEVRPGLTGWAQINGRNNIPISKRIELDVWYVDHLSLALDLRILLLTVPRVLRSRGVAVAEREDAMDLGPGDAAAEADHSAFSAAGPSSTTAER
jgi:lipopolysaccharide/colanic/teichoic acid biosynthesis glycosyltransferase